MDTPPPQVSDSLVDNDDLAHQMLPSALAHTLTVLLDESICTLREYADNADTGVDSLKDILEKLACETQFDNEKFINQFNNNVNFDAELQLKTAKERSKKAVMQRGSVDVVDEETQLQQKINLPPDARPLFVSGIDDTTLPKQETLHIDISNPEKFHDILNNIFANVITKAIELEKLIPSYDEFIQNIASDTFTSAIKSKSDLDGFILHSLKSGKIIQMIKRKNNEIQKLLTQFAEDPEETAAKWLYESNKTQIETLNKELALVTILEKTAEIYHNLDKSLLKKSKARPEIAEVKSKKRKATHNQKNTSHLNETGDSTSIQEMQEYSDTKAEFSLAWVNGGLPTKQRVESFNDNSKKSAIIHAIDPKLIDIAKKTYEKTEIAHKINIAIDRQAWLLANGIMPWEPNSGAKRVDKNGQAPSEYRNETIWYTSDIRPNSPRVYFVIKTAKELNITELFNQNTNDQEIFCMVVIAITDKKNQIDVLQRLTGKSHSWLKSKGAGAI